MSNYFDHLLLLLLLLLNKMLVALLFIYLIEKQKGPKATYIAVHKTNTVDDMSYATIK